MSESIVHINGKEMPLESSSRLEDILRAQGIDPSDARGIAVAVNERIVRKGDWSQREVQAGDAIEIVTARQGG